MSEHFIVRCRHCNAIIGQCRCPAKDKLIKYDVCDACKLLHPSEKKDTLTETTVETQKSLPVLLDEWEQAAVLSQQQGINSKGWAKRTETVVKALRRAVYIIDALGRASNTPTQSEERELSALLNQGRTTQDFGEL